MFGISQLGWLHVIGSFPAIPTAIYMLARHGRIVPRSRLGVAYLASMFVGASTVFLIAKQPASSAIGAVTLVLLLLGYGVGWFSRLGKAAKYLETVFLSLTVFLLMVPTVSETLRRVPDGHPLATDLKSPILLAAQGILFLILVVGLAAQILYLRKRGRTVEAATVDVH